ncbi:MAG: hypothetical protein HUJ68_12860 [Clostridia bacterium]|nr:hypothetical protein [Clostridia bacterium]
MKNKIFLFLSALLFPGTSLFAVEDRSRNFECINIYTEQIVTYIKDILTADEATETLKDVVYLLGSSYVDFDEVEKNGFDKEAFLKNGEELFRKEICIQNEKIFDYIVTSLEPYINDSHFNIWGKNRYKQLVQMKNIYISDTYVKKIKYGYKVLESNQIPKGTVLDLPEENVFKAVLNGKEVYRVGILTTEKSRGTTVFPIYVNNEEIKIRCSYSPVFFPSNEFLVKETPKSIYFNIPIFNVGTEHYKQFNEYAEIAGTKKNIIIDLRQNPGGDDTYHMNFLYTLFSGKKDESILEDFYSRFSLGKIKNINSLPIIGQYKMWLDYYHANNINDAYTDEYIQKLIYAPLGISYKEGKKTISETKAKFKGNIIFLTSKTSASTSEDIIIISKKLFDNVWTVGTNTSGCVKIINNYLYRLKKSGIVFQVGCMQDENYFMVEEGSGIIPDYLVLNDIEDTVRYITKDKKIAEAISEF